MALNRRGLGRRGRLVAAGLLGIGLAVTADAGAQLAQPGDRRQGHSQADWWRRDPIDAAPAGPVQALTLASRVGALREAGTPDQDNDVLRHATRALALTADLDLRRASKALNEALRLDPSNASLHFFNGFVYHLMARQGDTSKTDLALEGYLQATRLDPGNWIAREFLGLGLLEQKQYERAAEAFAEVLLVRPDDPAVLARMLAAAYLARDAATACGIADRLAAHGRMAGDGFWRAAVPVYAACGRTAKAAEALRTYERLNSDGETVRALRRRLEDWDALHGELQAPRGPVLTPAQFSAGSQGGGGFGPPSDNNRGSGAGQPVGPADAPSTAADFRTGRPGTRMVLVDVVMLRTEDSIGTSRGVNLLGALNLQFGSASGPAFGRSVTQSAGTTTTVLSRAVTVPALTYAMNIANAYSSLTEVLARPTLAAVEGMRSEFFSGTNLNAAVVSSGGVGAGNAVSLEKRYGVKLAVLPQTLPDGQIRLAIEASRTFLTPPSENIGYTYKLEISEIQASANVVMRMGDTLVLGGLSEKETTTTRDGVPGLQDLPLAQYLFSQEARTDYQKSVLILITPRPASYTWLSEESRQAEASGVGGASKIGLDALRARHGDWFSPYPNLASVFSHLGQADLYREFRTGDVTLERWERMDTTRQRLKQALRFLYY